MSVKVQITSVKTNYVYEVRNIKSYKIEQSIDIAADAFEIVFSNKDSQITNIIGAGDSVEIFVNNKSTMKGIIDDLDAKYNIESNDARITGRDPMSILLDNDATPKTYYNLGIKSYMDKILPKYNIKNYSSSSNKSFDKIVVSPGESEYTVLERLSKERGLTLYYDSDGYLRCNNLRSDSSENYTFSNNIDKAIKILDATVSVSNDIRNEVVVYGGDSEESKLKGSYKDSTLKTKKRRVINESDVEKESDAIKRAKEEFYDINKKAFTISITTTTKQPIFINYVARIKINRLNLDVKMLIDSVSYTKSTSGTITEIGFVLIQGVKTTWKNNDIPVLPKID